jgi:hypothetical protein
MQASSGSSGRRRFWLEAGPRRTVARRLDGRTLQVLVWRLAAGWQGRGGVAAAWVLPLAVLERQAAQERWRPVPNLTLAVNVLGLALAAWVIVSISREETERWRNSRTTRERWLATRRATRRWRRGSRG